MEKSLYFEVCQKSISTLSKENVRGMIKKTFDECEKVPLHENLLTFPDWEKAFELSEDLKQHVDSIICVTDRAKNGEFIAIHEYRRWKIFVYSLNEEKAAVETMQHDSEELSVASHIILPNVAYEGLWETLYYDTNIKNNLLHFIESTIIFSDKKVDPNIISWNKVILLHGPPGTGKTSLCKALAQKAAIRLGDRYSYVEFIEINSHSLFSKWFSESGKLVMKLFDEVRRLLQNPEALVCLLIDEVESLAHARKSSANGTEPSDSIRVVNALLTQLDEIKNYPNVMILTTSNVTEAIDLAFVDRADIKQYIGEPREEAIYSIYKSCIRELTRKGLVTKDATVISSKKLGNVAGSEDKELRSLSRMSIGMSGRSLRKIPFLTHALHVQSEECCLDEFFQAMATTIQEQNHHDPLNAGKK